MLGVLDLKRPQLRVFLFRRPVNTAPGESDNADNNQDDADDPQWFHLRLLEHAPATDQLNDQHHHGNDQ